MKPRELFVDFRCFDCDLGWHNRSVAQYPHVGEEGIWMIEKSAYETLDTKFRIAVDVLRSVAVMHPDSNPSIRIEQAQKALQRIEDMK